MSDYEDSFEQSSSDSEDSRSNSGVGPSIPTAKPATSDINSAPVLSSRAKAAIESGEWRVQKDPTTGRPYYYHVKTHHTTWDLDEELRSSNSDDSSVTGNESNEEKSGREPEAAATSSSSGERSQKDHSSSTDPTADHSSNSHHSDNNNGSMTKEEEKQPPAAALARRRTALVPPPMVPVDRLSSENQINARESSAGSGSMAPSDPIGAEFQELSKFVAFKGSLSSTASPNIQVSAGNSVSLNPEKVPFPLPVPVPVVTGNNNSSPSRSESKLKTATSTSTDNDDGLSAALLERKKIAAKASQLDEYQNLEQFVAFGDRSAATSSSRVRNETSTDSPTHTDLTRHSAEKDHESDVSKPDSGIIKELVAEEKKDVVDSENNNQPVSALAVNTPTSPKELQPEKTLDNTDASSIFSTLSQHLTAPVKLPSSTFSAPLETALPLAASNPVIDNAAAASASSTSKLLEVTEKSATAHVVPQLTPPTVNGVGASAAASPVSITLQMPPLPTISSLSPIPPLSTALKPPKEISSPLQSSPPVAGAAVPTNTTPGAAGAPSASASAPILQERSGLTGSSLPLPPALGTSLFPSGSAGFNGNSLSLPLNAQQREEQRVLLQHEQRIDELRETSLAVERLVQAFATLRGHGPAPAAELERLSNRTVENRTTTPMHRVGATSTMKMATQRPAAPPTPLTTIHRGSAVAAPLPSPASLTADEKIAQAANQKILEDVIRDCVISLLAERKGEQGASRGPPRPFASSTMPHPFSARAAHSGFGAAKHHISVSAEDFAYSSSVPRRGTSSLPLGGRSKARGHLSVFDGEMSAFAPVGVGEDADADTALQQAIEQALEKYLWSRVVRPPGGGQAAAQRNQLSNLAPFITPHVAWVLLLDVMVACRQIIEWGFVQSGEGSSIDYPVLVRFDGPVAMDEIARATMHCLPFEALSGLTGENGPSNGTEDSVEQRKRSIFRLEYWVTRERMFSILDAVSLSLRQHIVLYASELHYAPFYNDTEAICLPNGIVPPHSSFFSVVPPPSGPHATAVRRQNFRDGIALSNEKPPRGWKAKERFMAQKVQGDKLDPAFGVGEDAVERLAHVVSSLATDILTKENSHVPKDLLTSTSANNTTSSTTGLTHLEYPTDFPQLCTFVAETACELFEDVSVKAAIERRAAVKMKEYYASRGTYAAGSRLDREKQLIQKAEAQAENLVSRIMQELHAQKVKESRSLTSR